MSAKVAAPMEITALDLYTWRYFYARGAAQLYLPSSLNSTESYHSMEIQVVTSVVSGNSYAYNPTRLLTATTMDPTVNRDREAR